MLQSSKNNVIPENYIALSGDSYAEGLGDWFYHQASTPKAPYHSAHLIQESLKRDVLSFGAGGTGSVRGMVSKPVSALSFINAGFRTSVADPDIILFYFYEGNDLNDNAWFLKQAGRKYQPLDKSKIYDQAYFENYLTDVALGQDSLYQKSLDLPWYKQLFLGQFMARAIPALIISTFKPSPSAEDTATQETRSPLNPPGRFEWSEPGQINKVLVDGQTVQLPDHLQGPSMDLTDEEKQLALYTFRISLGLMKKQFPNSQIAVLYIPSVITSYTLESDQVLLQSHARRKQHQFEQSEVINESQWIMGTVSQICAETATPFLDASPFIRQASSQKLVHGPLDWNHFNQHGYEALTEAALQLLSTLGSP